MRNELEEIENIEKFLQNKLEGDDLRAFEQKMQEDAAFKQKVNLQKSLVQRIQHQALFEKIEQAHQRNTGKLQFHKQWSTYVVGVSLIALIGLLFFNTSETPVVSDQKVKVRVDSVKPDFTYSSKEEEKQIPLTTQKTKALIAVKQTVIDSGNNSKPEETWENYCESHKKESQYFMINPKRDTVLLGKEGTIIEIPRNSIAHHKNNDSVKILLREYYEISDILINDLTTTSNEALLETGGMLYLMAFNKQNKPLKINKNKAITCLLPTKNESTSMLKFMGAYTPEGINWIVEQDPEDLRSHSICYDCSTNKINLEHLQELDLGNHLDIILEFDKPSCAVSKVDVDYVFSMQGEPVNESEAWISSLKNEINEKYLHSKNWIPSSSFKDTLRFFVVEMKLPGNKVEKILKMENDNRIFEYAYYQDLKKSMYEPPIDAPTYFKMVQKHMEIALENKYIRCVDDYQSTHNTFREIIQRKKSPLYFVMKLSSFGMSNCDGFLDPKESKDLMLAENFSPHTYLLLKNSKTLVKGKSEEGGMRFKNIPKNTDGMIISIANTDTAIRFLSYDINSDNPINNEKKYEYLNSQELEARLKELKIKLPVWK